MNHKLTLTELIAARNHYQQKLDYLLSLSQGLLVDKHCLQDHLDNESRLSGIITKLDSHIDSIVEDKLFKR